jgi:hypothetical protein
MADGVACEGRWVRNVVERQAKENISCVPAVLSVKDGLAIL